MTRETEDPRESRRGQRRVEREFGVVFPGDILAPERWTQTAFRRWPAGLLDWRTVFGRSAPVVVDLGCGNGRAMIASALLRPGMNHFAIDELPVVIRYATRRANQRGLSNLRFAVGEASEMIARRVPAGSLAEVHVYHPQPYYDPAQVHRRLITPRFLASVHRALQPVGLLVLQTDHPAYWRYIEHVVPYFFQLTEHPDPWPESPRGRTRREILARARGLPIFRGVAEPRRDIDPQAAAALAEQLPEPRFDADRRLMELDRDA